MLCNCFHTITQRFKHRHICMFTCVKCRSTFKTAHSVGTAGPDLHHVTAGLQEELKTREESNCWDISDGRSLSCSDSYRSQQLFSSHAVGLRAAQRGLAASGSRAYYLWTLMWQTRVIYWGVTTDCTNQPINTQPHWQREHSRLSVSKTNRNVEQAKGSADLVFIPNQHTVYVFIISIILMTGLALRIQTICNL